MDVVGENRLTYCPSISGHFLPLAEPNEKTGSAGDAVHRGQSAGEHSPVEKGGAKIWRGTRGAFSSCSVFPYLCEAPIAWGKSIAIHRNFTFSSCINLKLIAGLDSSSLLIGSSSVLDPEE